MGNHNVHIGELIKKKLEAEEHSVAWLARKICMDPSNLRKKMKKDTMDTELLDRISNALNHSFFDYYKNY